MTQVLVSYGTVIAASAVYPNEWVELIVSYLLTGMLSTTVVQVSVAFLVEAVTLTVRG